jgi:uncharacterized protein (DUF58 family)
MKASRIAQPAREFLTALALLAVALYLAFKAADAARQGAARQGIALSLAALALATLIGLAFVPRLARRVAASSRRMPFSFSVTREGWVYIAAIFLLSLAAINTGNNLLFMILAAFLSAIVTSGIVARNSLRSIAVSLQVPENVFVGEPVSIKVSLRNQKRFLPCFSILVEGIDPPRPSGTVRFRGLAFWKASRKRSKGPDSISVLHNPAYFPIVRPQETRSELVIQSFPRRGTYILEGFRISTRYPFGFFRRGERVRAEGKVLVYPSTHEVSSYFHLLPFLPGRLEGPHIGQGESLYSIRDYREGESARVVDWKATAKTGVLMAREYAREEESKFCLILDTIIHQTAPSDHLDRFEKAVSLAASLALHFCEEGSELELLTPYEYVPRGIGLDHLYRLLRSLAVVNCEVGGTGGPADFRLELSGVLTSQELSQVLSDKIFKIIITSKPKGCFPAAIWRSSHVVFFDEL